MAWECKSCHRQIQLNPDPRGCDDEPICWHCLYEHREALLEACEAVLQTSSNPRTAKEQQAECEAWLRMMKAVNDVEGLHKEAMVSALLNTVIRYRAHHDMCLPISLRPCRCDICAQADSAIAAAKRRWLIC